ncbi:MAG: 3'-5' exonuclease domain-containing protein 2 [Betaproteobacteria bacterium]|nr:3'-5' exonuclease domain-containing protein 2 [Betaproteobacteria bacterium]
MRGPGISALPAEFLRPVSREEINALPIRRYEGEVLVVGTMRELERAWEDLARETAVGWDTETRPAFRKGESHLPALVQAATASAVYLFQLQRMDFSAVVGGLFAEPTIVKAGISVADDIRALNRVFEVRTNSLVDLGTVAHRHGMKQTGLRNLAGIFLGFRVPKGTKTSNWAARQLSAQQVAYAATDAWVCRELYLRFRDLGLL